MTDATRIRVTLALVFLSTSVSWAQTPLPQESLVRWRFIQEIPLPAETSGRLDFLLTPKVFDGARLDLADLRLFDSAGHELPYARRVRRARHENTRLVTRDFNRVNHPDRSVEVSIDLGDFPRDHNRVEVETGGTNYRRLLRLEGSDDNKEWKPILDKYPVTLFRQNDQYFDGRQVGYTPSRYRYLRARVWPDPALDNDRPDTVRLQVLHTIRIEPLEKEWPAVLASRQPIRESTGGDYASAWEIQLPGNESVPWQRLEFDAEETEFSRPWRLEDANDKYRGFLANGEWNRVPGKRQTLNIDLNSEINSKRLRLVITDQRNTPLTLKLVKASSPAVQILFEKPASSGTLKLYFGNPDASDPGYDYARTLPNELNPQPGRIETGEVSPNPNYLAKPVPFTERSPILTYAVFGLVASMLLIMLFLLARRAIRECDAGEKKSEVTANATQGS